MNIWNLFSLISWFKKWENIFEMIMKFLNIFKIISHFCSIQKWELGLTFVVNVDSSYLSYDRAHRSHMDLIGLTFAVTRFSSTYYYMYIENCIQFQTLQLYCNFYFLFPRTKTTAENESRSQCSQSRKSSKSTTIFSYYLAMMRHSSKAGLSLMRKKRHSCNSTTLVMFSSIALQRRPETRKVLVICIRLLAQLR